ncbi:MAG TPA: ATP-binding protein, partial [Elusimicrobiales bacterium]|nr:ATP-binding protein [Elusimicrobiales bacterium]
MTLFNRLLLIIFGAGLIPILPTAGFLFYYQSVAKDNIQVLHENVAQMASLMISQKAEELDRRMRNMWDAGSDRATPASLKKTLARNPEFLFMAFTGPDGRELFSGGTDEIKRLAGYVDLSRNSLFRKAEATGRTQIGGFELIYNLPICRLVYPMANGRYAFAVINLRDLFVRLEMQKMGGTGGVFVADSEGRVFSILGESYNIEREGLKRLFSGPSRSSRGLTGTGGTRYLGSYAEVPGLGFYALALQDRWEAFKGINLITSLIAFFLLGISTVFYFSALLLSRRLVNPVSELIEGASRVARKNFKLPVKEYADITEMSALLKAFNAMMREVDRYHGLQVEEMLEEKQKLELLISLMHDAIILCDLCGGLLYANSAARSLLGLTEREKLDRKNVALQLKVLGLVNLRTRAPGDILELPGPYGARKYHRMSMQVLSSRTAWPSVFMVLRDVTLEVEMQRMKEDFFHAAAHDLRAPLLSMQGYIKLLERACAPAEKSADYLSNIKDSSARLFGMLENILDIARMDSGSVKPRLEPIDGGGLVSSVFEGFKALFGEKKIELKADVPDQAPRLKGDERLLRRVLENLLSNAYKFTPSGGAVTIGCAAGKALASFYVTDTGPGVPEAQREAIFEKYTRLETDKEEGRGFGLGLAISRKIVEMHKGSIRAEAVPSGG